MSARHLISAIVLSFLALPCAAAETGSPHHVTVPLEEVKAASPQCSQGVVYDDGNFNDFYSLGDGDPGDATVVMKFDLPPGTVRLDQVCACFTRLSTSSPSSMNFEVVLYNDNGPNGLPGTFLGAVSATASTIPVVGGYQFYPVDLSGSGIVLPDTSVYVGARWPGGSILLCGDRSAATPQRLNYGSGNSGSSWTSLQSLFPTVPPRAMGIRLDPATNSSACTPSATALCLNNGRFKVEATFETAGGLSGKAQVVKLTDETGYLWFFSATNVEAVVKVLNACTFNQRFWVFAGGLTDVRVVITVTDTQTNAIRTYTNPLGRAFQPIQDTSAFATCP
jgi:hypothetical protein